MPNWAALLAEGDFSGALAFCLHEFTSQPGSLEASWAIAEIKERWGDSLLVAGEPDAAGHYRAARMALIPPGAQFTSAEENARRMEAHSRVVDKLYAIDPSGKLRPGHGIRPHPNSTPAAQTDKVASPHGELAIEKPRMELEDTAGAAPAQYAQLFQGSDHWSQYDLGVRWREAGTALAQLHPGAARSAYGWSLLFFNRYREAWRDHLPASRWDSDGASEIAEIRNLMEALAADSSEQPLPAWVEALFSGDWQRALGAISDAPPEPQWAVLTDLLAGACQAAGQPDDAGRRKWPGARSGRTTSE